MAVLTAVSAEPGGAERLLSGLLGVPVALAHLCPACGSDGHGRPSLRGEPGTRDVSVAHCGTLTAVALAPHGRVGIDLERRDACPPSGVPDAAAWVAIEAMLKASGTGLRGWTPDAALVVPPGARFGSVDAGPEHVCVWCWLP